MFLKHPGMLWLKKHDKSKLPIVTENLQALFDEGNTFEEYANKLFENSFRVGFTSYQSYLTMPARTEYALSLDQDYILQGRIESGNTTCIFDTLQKIGTNEYNLFEIKASTEVKDDHIYDLAFQTVTLENAGMKIRQIFVIHANREYVRNGDIEIEKITIKVDVTQSVRDQIENTKVWIKEALRVALSKTPPDFSPRYSKPNALSDWLEIYHLIYPEKKENSIFRLTRLNPEMVGNLEDLGVEHIHEIPGDFKLGEKQSLQVAATKSNKRTVKKDQIKKFIASLEYPLYFFDYETFSSVIPAFDGTRPYQQVPFQYSIHLISEPGAKIVHKEFLHMEKSLPCLLLLQKLKADIGSRGSVIVWYENFEKSRNTELGQMFPEYENFLNDLNLRIVDLMTPFSQGWIVDKDFLGSASIKKVLPVLVEDLTHKKLNIQDGSQASRLWSETVLGGKNASDKDKIMKDLVDYCHLDTLAMVKLYEFLKSAVKG